MEPWRTTPESLHGSEALVSGDGRRGVGHRQALCLSQLLGVPASAEVRDEMHKISFYDKDYWEQQAWKPKKLDKKRVDEVSWDDDQKRNIFDKWQGLEKDRN